MRNKVLAVIMVLGIILGAVACSSVAAATDDNSPSNNVPPAPNKYLVFITGENFGKEANITKQVEVKVGNNFTIALDSNGTTGFQWNEQAKIADVNIIQQVAHNYVAPNGEALGQAGIEEWTFKAINDGSTTLKFSYDRPWEGGEKGVRTLELTVVVK